MNIPISGVILAGGQGRRMDGVDKGLQLLNGKPLVEWVLQRFSPQVSEVIISANRNLEQYARFGHPVVSDDLKDFSGPLAGIQRGLMSAKHGLMMSVPCDSPFLPIDLVSKLFVSLTKKKADLAVAKTGTQLHPVFCLCKSNLLPHLNVFLASGGRKIDAWFASLEVIQVDFQDKLAFANINTLQDLQQFSGRTF